MDIGPVEYVVIEFPGNRFDGSIAPEIAKLVDSGFVRILDLVFVKKDAAGDVTRFEFGELEDGSAFVEIEGECEGYLGDDDLVWAGEALAPDSAALFILWEDIWARDLAHAVWNAGGELIAGERVPRGVMAEIDAEVEAELASATRSA